MVRSRKIGLRESKDSLYIDISQLNRQARLSGLSTSYKDKCSSSRSYNISEDIQRIVSLPTRDHSLHVVLGSSVTQWGPNSSRCMQLTAQRTSLRSLSCM